MNHFSQHNERGKNYCKFNIIAHFKFSKEETMKYHSLLFQLISRLVKKEERASTLSNRLRKSYKGAAKAVFVHCGKLLESNVEMILF